MIEITINHRLGDAQDESGRSLLHYSAKNGQEDLTKLLIRQGCNINARDKNGMTPLMLAVLECDEKIVEILLNAKADIYDSDNLGRNVLHMAFNTPDMEPTTLILLLKKLEEIWSYPESISNQLISFNCPLYSAVLLRNTAVIRCMIEKGVDIEMKDSLNGWNALFQASLQCDVKTVQLLLDCNANLNALDNSGFNVVGRLHEHNCKCNKCSTRIGEKLEVLRLLIDRGISLTTVSSIGFFQVWTMLFHGSRETVAAVLQSNIDFNARDKYQQTLLHYLVDNLHSGVVDEWKLHIHKFNVNAYNTFGTCPLLLAVMACNLEAVKLLLDNGAKVNCIEGNSGETPLYKCFPIEKEKNMPGNRYDECVEILLQHNADPQVVSYYQLTVFDAAQVCELTDRLKLVIAHLAMLQRFGTPLTPLFKSKIDSHETFKEYFKSCQRVLAMNFYGNTDLFQLLTIHEALFVDHLDEKTCLRKLMLFSDNYLVKTSYKYYYNTLRKRIAKIICLHSGSCQCIFPTKVFYSSDISKLLNMKEKVLARQLRSTHYLQDFMSICYDTGESFNVDRRALKKRIVTIVYKTSLMDEATVGLMKIFNGRLNTDHLILNEILLYLDDESLKSLSHL